VIVDSFIFKNNQITLSPCSTFLTKTGMGLPRTEGSVYCVGLAYTSFVVHRKLAIRSLLIKIHQLRCAFPENPPTCEILKKKNELLSIHTIVSGFSDRALCSWTVIGASTLQLVDFPNKHSAFRRFFELALRSWWIFMRRGRSWHFPPFVIHFVANKLGKERNKSNLT